MEKNLSLEELLLHAKDQADVLELAAAAQSRTSPLCGGASLLSEVIARALDKFYEEPEVQS